MCRRRCDTGPGFLHADPGEGVSAWDRSEQVFSEWFPNQGLLCGLVEVPKGPHLAHLFIQQIFKSWGLKAGSDRQGSQTPCFRGSDRQVRSRQRSRGWCREKEAAGHALGEEFGRGTLAPQTTRKSSREAVSWACPWAGEWGGLPQALGRQLFVSSPDVRKPSFT